MVDVGSRSFIQLLIKGNSHRVLPVYMHAGGSKHAWLQSNCDMIVDELARLIANNIEDIEDKVWNDSSSEFDRSRYCSLVTGSDLICFVYNVDRRKPRYRLLMENMILPPSAADSDMAIDMKYTHIPIMQFSLRVWIYPAAEKSFIPVEFTI